MADEFLSLDPLGHHELAVGVKEARTSEGQSRSNVRAVAVDDVIEKGVGHVELLTRLIQFVLDTQLSSSVDPLLCLGLEAVGLCR